MRRYSIVLIAAFLILISTFVYFPESNDALKCTPFSQKHSEKKIVIRIDDIQAFAWQDISTRMIQESLNRGIPPVLGVIPKGLEDDKIIVDFLKSRSCNIEIAQHGWQHSYYEFVNLTEEQAYQRLIAGKSVLQRLFDEKIVTFIPPNNAYSNESARALDRAGFTIISSEGHGDFDYSASTYDFPNKRLVPIQDIVEKCDDSLMKKNLCIIMVHPQDYATNDKFDEEKFDTYLQLLDKLEDLNASFVRMKDLI